MQWLKEIITFQKLQQKIIELKKIYNSSLLPEWNFNK